MRAALLALLALLACGVAAPACSLTAALTYPSADDGDAENVVARGSYAYAALSERGLGVVELASGALIHVLPPPAHTGSVDDVALADGLVFALDARDGALSVWSLADARWPRLVAPPIEVPVGPFSGVSAGGGRVVVSGGTSDLTVWSYDRDGALGARGAIDVARGQPDVLVAPDGRRAYVSTHFETTVFGLTILDLETPTPSVLGRLVLDHAGFSDGGTKPASFPLAAALHADRLYVAYGDGVAVIDVSDARAPALVGRIDVGFAAVHIDIERNTAAVVGERMLALLDLSDAPSIVRTDHLKGGATGVSLADHVVAIAAGGHGVLFVSR